jgi:hypothetical protein
MKIIIKKEKKIHSEAWFIILAEIGSTPEIVNNNILFPRIKPRSNYLLCENNGDHCAREDSMECPLSKEPSNMFLRIRSKIEDGNNDNKNPKEVAWGNF